MIIFDKLDNYFVISADSQTFSGFEMTAPEELFRSFAVRFIISQSCSFPTFCIRGVPVLGTILLVLILKI